MSNKTHIHLFKNGELIATGTAFLLHREREYDGYWYTDRRLVELSKPVEFEDAEEMFDSFYESFTDERCGHEHDCCGCIRESVSIVIQLTPKMYDLYIHAVKNI
jgi:hypothetical protein